MFYSEKFYAQHHFLVLQFGVNIQLFFAIFRYRFSVQEAIYSFNLIEL